MARWRPFQELEELRQRLDRAFQETRGGGGWTLAIDLQEQDDKHVLRADIPGLKPDDVQLEVEDDVLTVTGTHEQSEEEQRGGFVRRERRFGSFSRSLTLPKGRQRRSDRGELQGRRVRGHDPAPERGRAPEGDDHAELGSARSGGERG